MHGDLQSYKLLCVFVGVCVCVYPTHSYCCVARLPIFHIIYTAETVTNHEELVVPALYILVFFVSMVTWLFSGLCSSHLWQWWSSPAHICLSACSGCLPDIPVLVPRSHLSCRETHIEYFFCISLLLSSPSEEATPACHTRCSHWAEQSRLSISDRAINSVLFLEQGFSFSFVNTIELLCLTVYSCPIWNSLCKLGCLTDMQQFPCLYFWVLGLQGMLPCLAIPRCS